MWVSDASICAWRRSSLILPNHVRNEVSAGTIQGPERLTSPTPRTPGRCVAMATAAAAGRSDVSGTRSERITAPAAASMRSVSSSSVSRPSAAASRRWSTVASRSASEARTSITRDRRLPQLVGQQAEQNRVATTVLERHVRAQEAFAGEPAPLGGALGLTVVRPTGQLESSDAKVLERPAGEEQNRTRRQAAPTRL